MAQGIESYIAALAPYAWPALAGIVIFCFRGEISSISRTIKRRLNSGDRFSIGLFQLDSTRVSPNEPTSKAAGIYVESDDWNDLNEARESIYAASRNIVLVHRVFRSREEGQFFDVETYCVSRRGSSISGLQSVRYCFGKYGWSGKTYRSDNRFNGFAVTTSAYGPMLCVAKLTFSDGSVAVISRYLDFEMGLFAVEPTDGD